MCFIVENNQSHIFHIFTGEDIDNVIQRFSHWIFITISTHLLALSFRSATSNGIQMKTWIIFSCILFLCFGLAMQNADVFSITVRTKHKKESAYEWTCSTSGYSKKIVRCFEKTHSEFNDFNIYRELVTNQEVKITQQYTREFLGHARPKNILKSHTF